MDAMRLFTLARAVSAIATCVLLSSCLDYDEECWIHNDLSGEAVIKLTLPDALQSKFPTVEDEFTKEKLLKRFDLVSGVTLAESSVDTSKLRHVVTLHVKFVSLQKLDDALAANVPAGMLAGRWEVKRDKGIVTIDRKLGTVQPKGGIGPGCSAVYVIHFDSPLAHTNSGFYDGSHNTVRYRYKVDDIESNVQLQSNSLTKPMPWLAILISVLVIGGGAWFGWENFAKKKKSGL
jgi:hypothetical protein